MIVYKAINAVQAALAKSGISKLRRSDQGGGYDFRGIDDVYNALAPLLAEHGLCILPRTLSRSCDLRTSAKGNALYYVVVEVEFDFVAAEDGSKHTIKTYGEAMDSGDKATNKAMSAAYKYAAFQAFSIPTEADNDTENNTPSEMSEEHVNLLINAAAAASRGIESYGIFFKEITKEQRITLAGVHETLKNRAAKVSA